MMLWKSSRRPEERHGAWAASFATLCSGDPSTMWTSRRACRGPRCKRRSDAPAGAPWKPGVAHGTLTVACEGEPLEITTYRTDGVYSDGRHPDSVAPASSIEEDLQRRDFTINALAYHPRARDHRSLRRPGRHGARRAEVRGQSGDALFRGRAAHPGEPVASPPSSAWPSTLPPSTLWSPARASCEKCPASASTVSWSASSAATMCTMRLWPASMYWPSCCRSLWQ